MLYTIRAAFVRQGPHVSPPPARSVRLQRVLALAAEGGYMSPMVCVLLSKLVEYPRRFFFCLGFTRGQNCPKNEVRYVQYRTLLKKQENYWVRPDMDFLLEIVCALHYERHQYNENLFVFL